MKRRIVKIFTVLVALQLLTMTLMEAEGIARVGGGRSSGSRGSRSYSTPSRSYSQPSPYRQQTPPPPPYRQAPASPPSGGFLKGLAGGLVGGLLGSMLFRGLGFAGHGATGGFGGSGIGLIEILLFCGIGYLIYRMIRKRRQESMAYQPYSAPPDFQQGSAAYGGGSPSAGYAAQGYRARDSDAEPYGAPAFNDLETGLSHIRQMDPSFDEARFTDQAMDMFFRIQGVWTNRDLAPAGSLLTDEFRRILQDDLDKLVREKRINRLENIAVRNVDIVEAWQESGQDFITVRFYANLLDYVTDEAGTVLEGSKTEPVKFEEYWTFTRPVGAGGWKLSAIGQV